MPYATDNPLTHLDDQGTARMVDVSAKAVTHRVAVAKGRIRMSPAAADLLRRGASSKGDVLQIATIAAIAAAKKTSDLIPLCHLLPLEGVTVSFDWSSPHVLEATGRVQTTGKTGVEMEALTAVSVGLLTVYDMLKAVDREMVIESILLDQKSGGRSGEYRRAASPLGDEEDTQ